MDWEPAGKNGSAPKGKKKRGCLIVVAVVVVLAVIGGISRCAGGGSNKLEWPTSGLATMLPKPDSSTGNVSINNDETLSADIDDYTQEKFDAYVAQCQEMGFTVEATADADGLDAFSEDGHHLTLSFHDYSSGGSMDVRLEAPIEMSAITWPTSGAGSLVPAPTSTTGKIDSDSSSFFFAYVGETDAEAFGAYVDACADAGFDVDYNRGDTLYTAENADGVSLTVEFRGFDTMTVRVEVPDDEGSAAEPAPAEPEATEPEEPEATEPETDAAATSDGATSGGASADGSSSFRATMDAYEAFMNEYCDFMEKYENSSDTVGMLADYADMMSRYADFTEQIDDIDQDSLSPDDLAYYTEVMTRVNARVAEIGQ